MKIYLAGINKGYVKDMKLFLAESGGMWEAYFSEENFLDVYILQSFFYADDFTEKYIIPKAKEFMLDSGAFTFMTSNRKKDIDWENYIERYAQFIIRNKIDKYFELDIDSVVGYEKVLDYRRKLEKLTGKQCIPVWHKSRGLTEFKKMCDEYNYVSIGGIVSKEIKPNEYKAFPAMITEAHKRKAKIHGLGFTSLTGLSKYHFDSVDSTSWTLGNRIGAVYYFDGKTMIRKDPPKGKKLSNAGTVSLFNYREWVKFQKYAERNL